MLKQVAQMSLAFEYLSFEYNIAIVKWKLYSSDLFWRDLPLFYAISHGIVGFGVAFATFWLSIIYLWVKTNIMRDYCHLGVSNIFFTNIFLFFRSFFALFRPKQRPRMGVKILLTSKIKFFLISQQYFLSYWTWFEPFSPNTFDWKIIKDFGVQWTPYGLNRDYLSRAE